MNIHAFKGATNNEKGASDCHMKAFQTLEALFHRQGFCASDPAQLVSSGIVQVLPALLVLQILSVFSASPPLIPTHQIFWRSFVLTLPVFYQNASQIQGWLKRYCHIPLTVIKRSKKLFFGSILNLIVKK